MKNQDVVQQMERDRIAVKEGITDSALAVLKRHFRDDLPVFQFRENGGTIQADAQTLALMAAVRDGAKEVIQYIETLKNLKPYDINENE